jgi:hypothetical protein
METPVRNIFVPHEQFRNRRARAFPAAETLFAKVCGRMVCSLFGFWFLAFKLKSPPGKEEAEGGETVYGGSAHSGVEGSRSGRKNE